MSKLEDNLNDILGIETNDIKTRSKNLNFFI